MVKIFDERDLDFYNPNPYMKKMMSFLDTEAINNISWYLDEDRYDYLFKWPPDISEDKRESKRYRVFVDNVLDIVKPEHQQVLFTRIISKVENFQSNLESNIRAETIAIQEREELILSAQEYIAEKKANLDRLNAIQKEYSRP